MQPAAPPYRGVVKPGGPIRASDINAIPGRAVAGIAPGTGVVKIQMGNKAVFAAKGGGPGGGGAIPRVLVLPPIPKSGYRAVFWLGNTYEEGGTGDYQEWKAFAGQDRYFPMQKATDKSGVPVEGN